ncbi:uncharacterized protein CC84DRAFT_1211322 [Paraphaeosphaeria sporulosa]|uniref:F-box domain-containing protein n=1 Tax=Paraphaeosphaeria sporulosa TaxID=1460663 RepID=A0A177CWT7_9PLEO|nr:uncharacterized protein CC84DRAFT_1211322 [Paraphaeosphaeria sporulosa]OAG11671.1 hypothetical protein CC84DRAFT_1211322 [Paraphaeosphaeria sporulosa]
MAGNATSQSRLLQLPGELRNRIYDFAREEGPVGEQSTTRSQPLFLGLTQTCRVIRNEYRPTYMAYTMFSMRLLDAYTFIPAYVKPHGEDSHGCMLINFDYGFSSIETNVLPLLKQLRRFSSLTAVATCSDITIQHAFRILLSACAREWFDDIAPLVTRITIKKNAPRHIDQAPRTILNWYLKCTVAKSPFFLSENANVMDIWAWEQRCFQWLFLEKDMNMHGLEVNFRPLWSGF